MKSHVFKSNGLGARDENGNIPCAVCGHPAAFHPLPIHDEIMVEVASKIDLKKLIREVMENFEFSPFVPIVVDPPAMKNWAGELPNPDFVDVKPISRDGKG